MACRVLVVDDEETVRDVFARALSIAGCEVRTATDGMEGLAALAAAPADVVVTDLLMPGLRGEILAEQVRTQFPEVRVVVVSGWIAPQMRPLLDDSGVSVVLQKPLDSFDALVQAVLAPSAPAQGMAS